MRDKECDQMIVYRVTGKQRQNENPLSEHRRNAARVVTAA